MAGYLSTGAGDTFTHCPVSRKLEPLPAHSPQGSGSLFWSVWMATPGKLEFGLLPERRMDWRTLATSYGLEIFIILLLLGAGFFFPATLRLRERYRVTELIPRPDLKPEPVKPKAKVRRPAVVAKLPPPVAFPAAKLFVPKDIRTP